MKRRIAHVITGLPVGGSETMLMKLLAATDRKVWEPEVISLRDVGVMGERIAAMGIPVRALGMRERPADVAAPVRLLSWLRSGRPDVVQTWLYHADLIAGLAAWAAGVPVIWGIRQSNLQPGGDRRSTIWIARVCALLSRRVPRRIVCCSEASRRNHLEMGYAEQKMIVIPNGFDLRSFHSDPQARTSVRMELGLSDSTPLIGLIARFDPQKDHGTFVAAARRLHRVAPHIHFVLCGKGIDAANGTLQTWISDAGLEAHCHLLGQRDDIPRLTAALDVASLSSAYGEGFPNVIGEAMACAVPCVATDVGECGAIIGDTGTVVPAKDPEALARAWQGMIEAGVEARSRLGAAARRRIENEFDIDIVARRYSRLHEEVLERPG
jgi:glycosyltransferase involved in cell wall biosynthesis